MDEVSFGVGMDIKKESAKMMDTYNAIKARMKSRFIAYGGNFPAVLFMVSSKKSELDFLETYIKKVKNDPDTFIVDEPIWKVKPQGTYCGKTFKVAVGNKTLESKIVEEDENLTTLEEQGYRIIDVPIEYRTDFQKDMNKALMDLAGISSVGGMKFLSGPKYRECVGTRKNPFTADVVSIGLDDKLQIADFFIPDIVPESDYKKQVYVHIDSSLKGDRTGISGVAIEGAGRRDFTGEEIDRLKELGKEEEIENGVIELRYKHLFTIGIKAPSDSEISLSKTRQFIYHLKRIGWNIKGVSIDGFQSADTRQILTTQGIQCDIRSLDRTKDGYNTFKSALYDHRIDMLDIKEMEEEAVELESGINLKDKVDHPQGGSKDLIDSVAGAVWNASFTEKSYIELYGADLDTMLSISTGLLSPVEMMKDQLRQILANDKNAKETARNVVDKYSSTETVDITDMTNEELEAYKKEANKNNDDFMGGVSDGILVF